MALVSFFFFFKQKTAYEIQGDWSSDVCSSDLSLFRLDVGEQRRGTEPEQTGPQPALAQLFLHEDEPVERLFRLADPASRLEPDGVSGALVIVPDLSRHDHADGEGREIGRAHV